MERKNEGVIGLSGSPDKLTAFLDNFPVIAASAAAVHNVSWLA